MLKICEDFSIEHSMLFSTDENAAKSKTKCMVFTKTERNIPNVKLNGNNLPFVTSAKHLGNTIENDNDFTANDIKIKRARYIQRNNELNQEFHFARGGLCGIFFGCKLLVISDLR